MTVFGFIKCQRWDIISHVPGVPSSDIGKLFADFLQSKSLRLLHLRLFDFLMRGGDSEFINYLKYILQGKCVQSVYEF